MKVEFIIDAKRSILGETTGTKASINLYNSTSHIELIDTIIHETLHSVFNSLRSNTNEKQDHYMFKRLSTDWF